MRINEPIPHWNNFTVPELREILEHCVALERLGIAQDEEMVLSIERDIILREKKASKRQTEYESRSTKMRLPIMQSQSKASTIARKSTQHRKQQPEEYLLEQKV